MAKKIRLLALGCAAAALLGSVQASVVNLDFEAIGIAAPAAGTPVGSTFASDGVIFSANAIANHNGLSSGNAPGVPVRPAAEHNFGFVRNALDSATGSLGAFTIQFAAGKSFIPISLEWSAAADFQVKVFDRAGTSMSSFGLSGAANGMPWGAGWRLLDLTPLVAGRDTDHISFSSISKLRFAIDNFQFATTSGSTVPEPAGFGLVAVALAGAGLASRRSRKA